MSLKLEPQLIPFREHEPVRTYKGNHLPHLRQDGCSYFVKLRLADSVPQGAVNQWRQERTRWLGTRNIDPHQPDWQTKFVQLPQEEQRVFERAFASKLFNELDMGRGKCQLREPPVREIVSGALEYFSGDRLLLGDYVIMPNHVHAIMTPADGFELEDILRSIKGWSAKQINQLLETTGEFWMKDSYDRLIRDEEELNRTRRYIAANPEKASLAEQHFLYRQSELQVS